MQLEKLRRPLSAYKSRLCGLLVLRLLYQESFALVCVISVFTVSEISVTTATDFVMDLPLSPVCFMFEDIFSIIRASFSVDSSILEMIALTF